MSYYILQNSKIKNRELKICISRNSREIRKIEHKYIQTNKEMRTNTMLSERTKYKNEKIPTTPRLRRRGERGRGEVRPTRSSTARLLLLVVNTVLLASSSEGESPGTP